MITANSSLSQPTEWSAYGRAAAMVAGRAAAEAGRASATEAGCAEVMAAECAGREHLGTTWNFYHGKRAQIAFLVAVALHPLKCNHLVALYAGQPLLMPDGQHDPTVPEPMPES